MTYEDLPSVGDGQDQSARAERAVESAFCEPHFICHRIPQEKDFGVDYLPEVRVDGHPTNFRFHLQLKSQKVLAVDKSRTQISVPIKTSRLHYLHRGVGLKMLVVYDDALGELYYEWTHVLLHALDSDEKDWRNQEEVTVHIPLANKIIPQALLQIKERVLHYYQRLNAIEPNLLVLGKLSDGELRTILDQGKTWKDTLSSVCKYGVLAVSQGYHLEVSELIQRIPLHIWASSSQVNLVLAYAHDRIGNPLQSLYYANRSEQLPDESALSSDDGALLLHIQLSSRLALGQLTQQSYVDGLKHIVSRYPETLVGKQCHLQSLVLEVRNIGRGGTSPDIDARRLLHEASGIVEDIESLAKGENEVTWGAQLLLAELEHEIGDAISLQSITEAQMAERMGYPMSDQRKRLIAEKGLVLIRSAGHRLRKVHISAGQSNRRDILAVIALTHVDLVYKTREFMNMITQVRPVQTDDENDRKYLESAIPEVGKAWKQLSESGLRQMALRALRLLADLFYDQGQITQSEELMAAVRREVKLLGLSGKYAEPISEFRKAVQEKLPPSPTTLTKYKASMSDEDVKAMARASLAALQLPQDRLEHLESEIHAINRIAREQLEWCKHLDMTQDLTHTKSKHTLYRQEPNRKCTCGKYGYTSTIENPDPNTIIKAFKAARCEGCAGREAL